MTELHLFGFLLLTALVPGFVGFLPILVALARRPQRETAWLLLLPGVWIGLFLLASLFAEPSASPRTAAWVDKANPVFAVAYAAAAVWTLYILPKARIAAALCAVANLPALVWATWMVTEAAKGGAWAWP